MKNKIIGIAILALVALAVVGLASTAFRGGGSGSKPKTEATQYTAEEATDLFKQFAVAAVGNKGTVLGAGCVTAQKQADGTYAQADSGPVYGCVIAVAAPGSQAVAECDQVVIRLVKPSMSPDVLDAQAIDPSTCTG